MSIFMLARRLLGSRIYLPRKSIVTGARRATWVALLYPRARTRDPRQRPAQRIFEILGAGKGGANSVPQQAPHRP
jgi:hypothetical protein